MLSRWSIICWEDWQYTVKRKVVSLFGVLLVQVKMEIHQIYGDSVIGFVSMFALMETGLAVFRFALAVFFLKF